MDKFRNKYRIQSHRMPQWDYSGNGFYFITIVTKNRECNLGYIHKGKMEFSDFGKIVNDEWLQSFEIRNELFLDEHIVMPNHLHAIVILEKTENERLNGFHETNDPVDSHDSHDPHVETYGRASLQPTPQPPPPNPAHQSIPSPKKQTTPQTTLVRKPQSISSFIAGFKSVINSKIDDFIDEHNLDIPKYNRKNHFFQPDYYDRIIRNDIEYQRIKNYIINNPLKWNGDKFNPQV